MKVDDYLACAVYEHMHLNAYKQGTLLNNNIFLLLTVFMYHSQQDKFLVTFHFTYYLNIVSDMKIDFLYNVCI
jgi:hypothetical protein